MGTSTTDLAPRTDAADHDPAHDFDFYMGTWRVHHRRLDGAARRERRVARSSRARRVAWPILGGAGNIDDNVLDLPERHLPRDLDPDLRPESTAVVDLVARRPQPGPPRPAGRRRLRGRRRHVHRRGHVRRPADPRPVPLVGHHGRRPAAGSRRSRRTTARPGRSTGSWSRRGSRSAVAEGARRSRVSGRRERTRRRRRAPLSSFRRSSSESGSRRRAATTRSTHGPQRNVRWPFASVTSRRSGIERRPRGGVVAAGLAGLELSDHGRSPVLASRVHAALNRAVGRQEASAGLHSSPGAARFAGVPRRGSHGCDRAGGPRRGPLRLRGDVAGDGHRRDRRGARRGRAPDRGRRRRAGPADVRLHDPAAGRPPPRCHGRPTAWARASATSTPTRRSGTRRMPPRSAPRSGGRVWPGATTWRPRSSPTPAPTRRHRSTDRAANRSTCGSATSGAPGTASRPSSARSSPPSTTGSPTSASRSAGTSATGTTTWSSARPTWWACRRRSSTDCLPARSPGAASSPRATRRRSRSSSSRRGAIFARSRSPGTTAEPPRSTPRSSPSSSTRDGAPHRSSAPTRGASSRTRPGCPAAGRRSWPSSRASSGRSSHSPPSSRPRCSSSCPPTTLTPFCALRTGSTSTSASASRSASTSSGSPSTSRSTACSSG